MEDTESIFELNSFINVSKTSFVDIDVFGSLYISLITSSNSICKFKHFECILAVSFSISPPLFFKVDRRFLNIFFVFLFFIKQFSYIMLR